MSRLHSSTIFEGVGEGESRVRLLMEEGAWPPLVPIRTIP